jgi:NodT family efflux transporter outer membrane factor (OMF) lipoprotein
MTLTYKPDREFFMATALPATKAASKPLFVSLAVALSSGLSGCAVGPDFLSPEPPKVNEFTPEKINQIGNQRLVAADEIPQRWWKAFHDQNLNKLIEASIKHSPGLQAADAAIRIAYFNAEAQKGNFLPSVLLDSNDSQNYQPPVTNAVSPNAPSNPYGLFLKQLTISYTPDIWGANRRAVESLEAQTDQQRYQLEAAYLTLTTNVASGAITEAMTRGQIEATREVIKEGQQLLTILRGQYRLGAVAVADVLAEEALLAQAMQLLPPLEKALAIQRDQLAALAGEYSTAAVPETFHLRSLTLPRALPLTLPSQFVRQRPDVRAAEANLHSASAQIGVAIAARLPNVTLGATPGVQGYTYASLFTPGAQFYTLTASITQPLFDGFSLMNKQKSAEEGLKQADGLYRQSLVAAFQNIADALRALQSDTKAVNAALYSEKIARRQLEIVKKQLGVGSVNVLILLNAQRTYLQALVTLVGAEGARMGDVVGLFMALGGDWKDEALKNLPPNTLYEPTKEQVEMIKPPVNGSWFPSIPKLEYTPF